MGSRENRACTVYTFIRVSYVEITFLGYVLEIGIFVVKMTILFSLLTVTKTIEDCNIINF